MKKISITLLLSILILGIFLTGCSQTLIQCQDGSFKETAELCSEVSGQTNCSELDCNACPVKTVEKTIIKYQCYDKTVVDKSSDCSTQEDKLTSESNEPETNSDNNAKLLFKSGFEDGIYIDKELLEYSEDYRIIRGSDYPKYSWPINVLGAKDSGLHYIADENQKAIFSRIEITNGSDGKPTQALYQQENYETEDCTQCPYEILDITNGTNDLYIKYWIKIDSESVTKKNEDLWRTFFEFKTKDYAKGTGFRLISFIYTEEDGKPYWHWQGDKDSENPIWEIDNKDVPVPLNEWFLTEFYWHWSENENGRALWKINNQTIGDHYGPTTRNSKPIDFIMLFQLYGNSNPKHQWIDNIEIWDNIPYNN